jgi:hypothetical protein
MCNDDDEYYCPNCDAILNEQIGFDPNLNVWTCEICGQELYGDDIESTMHRFSNIVWHCDCCGTVLNKQSGFTDSCESWRCTECGHKNRITEDEVYDSEEDYERDKVEYACPNCNCTLNDQPDFYNDAIYTCSDCGKKLYRGRSTYEICYCCPNCDEALNEQVFFNHDDNWVCTECGAKLYLDYLDDYCVCSDNCDDEDGNNDKVDDEDEGNDKSFQKVSRVVAPNAKQSEEILSLKKKIRKIRIRATCIVIFLIFVFILTGYIVVQEFNSLIAVGTNSDQLIGQDYANVVEKLREAGFEKILENNLEDLSLKEVEQERMVTVIKIGNLTDFSARSIFSSHTPIEITYHSLKKVQTPMSSKEARGKPYSRIVHDFENAGFTNIELIPEYDLIFGWINGEDDVASITMGDSLAFSSGESFRPDVEIRITYHALKKYKPD